MDSSGIDQIRSWISLSLSLCGLGCPAALKVLILHTVGGWDISQAAFHF